LVEKGRDITIGGKFSLYMIAQDIAIWKTGQRKQKKTGP